MKLSTTAALAALLLIPAGTASAASFTPPAKPDANGIQHVQYRPYVTGPRYFAGPRYAPRYAVGPRYFAPRGYAGRPYWFARPWGARPHYGTIVAGVALGTLVTVAAIGYAPRRPAPNLCWYWADPEGSQGYWDYCA
jgi:hypothetical protein